MREILDDSLLGDLLYDLSQSDVAVFEGFVHPSRNVFGPRVLTPEGPCVRDVKLAQRTKGERQHVRVCRTRDAAHDNPT